MRRKNIQLPKSQMWVVALLFLGGLIFASARPAFADPHAVFYTDRAQEQLFYNVLAALNQADFVEPPRDKNDLASVSQNSTDPAKIQSDVRFGDYIATGNYSPAPTRTVEKDPANPNAFKVTPALEPQERDNLPRIRVRQVTSDNGDVYYRERLERRALAEEMRVQLSLIYCRGAEKIYGPEAAESDKFCNPENTSPPVPPP